MDRSEVRKRQGAWRLVLQGWVLRGRIEEWKKNLEIVYENGKKISSKEF